MFLFLCRQKYKRTHITLKYGEKNQQKLTEKKNNEHCIKSGKHKNASVYFFAVIVRCVCVCV